MLLLYPSQKDKALQFFNRVIQLGISPWNQKLPFQIAEDVLPGLSAQPLWTRAKLQEKTSFSWEQLKNFGEEN